MKNFQNKTKIIKVSAIIRVVLFTGLFCWIIAIAFSLVNCFFHNALWRREVHDDPSFCSPTAFHLGCDSLVYIFAMMVNMKLLRFFNRLKKGCLFDALTVGHLAAAGKWWIAFWLYQRLFLQIGDDYFGTGNDFFVTKRLWDSAGLFAGLTLVFVAWLLKEAQALQEEQALTV
jgi:Protein of unknown function (DUF2975)